MHSVELKHSLAWAHLRFVGEYTGVRKDSATNLARAFSYSDNQSSEFRGSKDTEIVG